MNKRIVFPVKAAARNSGLWILSPWRDLTLFVLSPLWVIPLLWLAKSRFDPNGFGAMLLAIGATGHHLPGFIRAYTDPVLFRRFRARFVLAPLFLLGVYVVFFALHLESLKLLLILWGAWHGAMQVNGFLRIYDAKAGSFSKATSWLDWAMCIVWFAGALLYSSRLISILSHYFRIGGSPISSEGFAGFRFVWMAVAVAVTIAFLINAWRQARAGAAPSPVKLLTMVSSFALWWFAMVKVSSILVGLLLFEIVHDLQYNVLVWVYNQRRVSQGMTASRVEEFLFRPGVATALLYVLLIAGYGSIADVLDYARVQAPSVLDIGVDAVSFWTGLFMVSTFLHFYFDGFIWQVRETGFRQGLGIQATRSIAREREERGPAASTTVAGWFNQWAPTLKWGFFLIPAVALGAAEYRNPELPLIEQSRNVAELLPNRWQAHAVLGSLETVQGNQSDALVHLKRATALNPEYAYGEKMIADIHIQRGEGVPALQHYLRAAELNPANCDVQDLVGRLLVNERRNLEALPHLRIAVECRPTDAYLSYVLGASLVDEKRPLDGIPYLRRSLELDPRRKEALNHLGAALQMQGDLRSAAECYQQALEIDPQYASARSNLERVMQLLGK